ncbi:hypothetical protein [Persicobacter psychrovividus]|uniref:hypothetical protein n=1 Tax=Persicobacter psychrovividus TaxID=387638 RepID=UPI0030CA1753
MAIDVIKDKYSHIIAKNQYQPQAMGIFMRRSPVQVLASVQYVFAVAFGVLSKIGLIPGIKYWLLFSNTLVGTNKKDTNECVPQSGSVINYFFNLLIISRCSCLIS